MKKKYIIYTYGCSANVLDSEKIGGHLEHAGYCEADNLSDADIAIVNSCAIRHTAENKIWGKLGYLKEKKERDGLVVIFAGCMPVAYQAEIKQKYKWIDIVVYPETYSELPALIDKKLRECLCIRPDKKDEANSSYYSGYSHALVRRKSQITAFVEIMTGCNNFCSYCIVPIVRGRENSRNFNSIILEVKYLIDCGYQEVVLLGQNVNSYYDSEHKKNFVDLLEAIACLKTPRIRFFTSHPKDFDEKLPSLLRTYPNIARNIHLPMQAGCDAVLTAMNRQYTVEQYGRLKSRIDILPNFSCTTDIIVGFPGETEEQFCTTLENIKKFKFEGAYTFKYSARQKTAAALMLGQVPENEKKRRLDELMKIQNEISLQKNRLLIGSTQIVLVEGRSKNNSDMLTGKTSCNRTVNFNGEFAQIGKFVSIEITEASTWSLKGKKTIGDDDDGDC
jgi:tRNA-2-methylthio-N6-dimethylallyladenosine synthase